MKVRPALIAVVFLAACSSPPPTPPPIAASATAVPTMAAAAATPAPTVAPADGPSRTTPTVTAAARTQTATPAPTPVRITDGVPTVVELTSFAFYPPRLAAQPGQTIRLELRNLDIGNAHVLAIPKLSLATTVAAGSTVTMEFTVEEAGNYTFLCPLDTEGVNHAVEGMQGELVVEAEP